MVRMRPWWREAEMTMKPSLMTTAAEPGPYTGQPSLDLTALPKRMDRQAGAALVTHYFFPVSPRTIEAWPLVARRVNGRALYETAELLAFAKAKFDAAPAIRGGRRTSGSAA